MIILNLTQHQATPEQLAAGVVDLDEKTRQQLGTLLTFNQLPTPEELDFTADAIWHLAYRAANERTDVPTHVMIGGAPWLMSRLEAVFRQYRPGPGPNLGVLYAFSRRESVEEVRPDGSVVKRAVFRHVGFVRG